MDCEEYDRIFKETYISNDYMSTFYGEGDSVDEDDEYYSSYSDYSDEPEVESDDDFDEYSDSWEDEISE